MDELTQVVGVASNVSGFGWLAVIVYFLYKDGTLARLIGRVSLESEKTPQWATKLMGYVNHDQTEKIDRVLSGVENLTSSTNRLVNIIEQKIVDPLNKVTLKHDEWEKYGVPTRCIDETK